MSRPFDYTAKRTQCSSLKEISAIMIATLRSAMKYHIDLRYRHMHFDNNSLVKVIGVIASGQYLVFHDPSMEYNTGVTKQAYDVVAMSFDVPDSQYRRSALIHEAIHVRTDMRGALLFQMKDEVLAWIYQAMYLRCDGLQGSTYPGVIDPILGHALVIADALRIGSKPTPTQEQALETAIKNNSYYAGIDGRFTFADAVPGRR